MMDTKRAPGRPRREGGPDPVRSVRLGDVWDRAAVKAAANGERMRDVIERLLILYLDATPGQK